MQMESQILQVNIDDIIPNRFQPRLSFDDEGLKELSASIKEHGIIQPLVLRKLGNKYEIIAGERRYKASQMAGLTTVPAVISNIDDNSSAEVALVENIQRRDLTPIEEARSYKNLLDKGYLTQDQLAKKMGVSQSTIANKLRLLNLDDEVQQALLDGKISERHARSLLVLEDKEQQKVWLNKIITDRLTVRQLDQELKKINGNNSDPSDEIELVDINPNIEAMQKNAFDINSGNNNNIGNLMVPEEVLTDYSEQNTQEESNTPKYETLSNSFDILNQPTNNQPEEKEEPKFDSLLDTTLVDFNNFTTKDSNNMEIYDENLSTDNTPSQNLLTNQEDDEAMKELNPNNKFFVPINEEAQTLSSPTELSNSSIEFDPMSILGPKIEPESLNEPTSLNPDDLSNEIMNLVNKYKQQGIPVTINEQDTLTSHIITIDIEK